jgi:hypothetical protein
MRRPRTPKAISERVAVPGVRPASFKLVEKATDSFDLFRSSRKIGAARVETDGAWTARFDGPDGGWQASAGSAAELLRLVGAYLLLGEARAAAARPLEEKRPELRAKGKKSAEQALSIKLLRLGEERRLAQLDAQMKELRRSIRRAPRP